MLILHLSDIHFRKMEVETTQDPNIHLRNELVRDVRQQCEVLGSPDAIVISGDIAFAGDKDEFAFATDWLRTLCDGCGGSMDSVFVVPGNHDVVREIAEANLVQLIHRSIKAAGDPYDEIAVQMRDPEARKLLYDGLQNYNDFALQFLCDLLPPDRTRAQRDLLLNDGSTLRLWGLNTTLVSSRHDAERSLYVDPASLQITREDGVINFVVAHHHLSWLGGAQRLEDHLNDVAPIQLFGHVHTNRVARDPYYMRLTASATHPERHEADWEPGYNLIDISVEGPPDDRSLRISAHVRVWQTGPGSFVPKLDRGSVVFEHRIKLDPWQTPSVKRAATAEVTPLGWMSGFVVDSQLDDTASDQLVDGEEAMNTIRDIGLRFYRLSFSRKSEIAGRLELLEDEDLQQPDYERFRRVFMRAYERGRLDELDDAIREAERA